MRLKSAFETHSHASNISNTIARIDTNTFSLLLTDATTPQKLSGVIKSIHTLLEPIFIVEDIKLSVHANIGIVNFPEHGEDVNTLIQRVGIAVYMAQNSNSGHALYDASFDMNSPKRLTLMSELSQAVNHNQLELYYQPKVLLETGKVQGVEALVRWNHPKHGMVPPDDFIPMVKRTRSI